MGLQDGMVVLFLISWGTYILFYIVAVLIYILTNSAQRFLKKLKIELPYNTFQMASIKLVSSQMDISWLIFLISLFIILDVKSVVNTTKAL